MKSAMNKCLTLKLRVGNVILHIRNFSIYGCISKAFIQKVIYEDECFQIVLLED